uniref:Endonuclease III n=1 Tax=Trepomonas sp. PC1 TaxID=1076344 RepID=A0A146KA19_9EUKA|eukprot:JAP92575.1 Endonuclease III [Trepomonas sp. PC1]
MKQIVKTSPPPVQKYGAHCLSDTNKTPDGRLRFLVPLLLSAQTKDNITAMAIFRLDKFLSEQFSDDELKSFECESINDIKIHNLTFKNIKQAEISTLEKLIYPVGFYKKKALYLKKLGDLEDVPNNVSELIKLNGIGFKMAKIATHICWDTISGIAVDTHVQRITQKLGWAGNTKVTASANTVMKDLEDNIPNNFWGEINETVVGFGQVWCKAISPNCDQCKLRNKECKWKPQLKTRK